MSNNCYIPHISSSCLTTLSCGGRRGAGAFLDLLLEGGRGPEGAGPPAAEGSRRPQEEASAGGEARRAGRRREAAGGGGGAEGDGLHLHGWSGGEVE